MGESLNPFGGGDTKSVIDPRLTKLAQKRLDVKSRNKGYENFMNSFSGNLTNSNFQNSLKGYFDNNSFENIARQLAHNNSFLPKAKPVKVEVPDDSSMFKDPITGMEDPVMGKLGSKYGNSFLF